MSQITQDPGQICWEARPLADAADNIWTAHQDTLRRLYLVERKTLKQVKQVMESQHGFPKTP
jgi:hypothetical protein